MSETFEKISAGLDGEVPAAGGEVEVLGYRYRREGFAATQFSAGLHVAERFDKKPKALVDRAHVTRLQAENAALQQRLNVADQQNDELTADNARLQAEARDLRILSDDQRLNMKRKTREYIAMKGERDALQSELTKARELLGRAYDADLAARHHQPYNVSKVIDDIESFLAHQSAPAAKDDSDE